MALEVGSFINDLVSTNPLAADPVGQGDDHMRLVKTCVKGTFPQMGGIFSKAIQQDVALTIDPLANTDHYICTASATTTVLLTLPTSASVTAGWYIDITTLGGANVVVTPTTGSVNGAANFAIPEQSDGRIFYQGASVWRGVYGPANQSGASVINNLVVNGTSSQSGAAHFKTTVSVGGAATLASTLTVSGAATFGSTVTVSGATHLQSTLSVSGAATFASTMLVTGAAVFASNVTISGNAVIAGTLSVSGAALFNSTVTFQNAVTGISTLSISGAAHFNTTISVGGAATFSQGVTISGAANLLGTLSVSGAANFSGAVTISGAAVFKSGITVSGVAVIAGALSVSGAAVVQGNITANANLSVSGASILANLTVQGTTTLSGTVVLGIGQITFPAAQVASANANTLDDYEEGSWTPTITFATPGDLTVVYSARIGQYIKIGAQVIIEMAITTSTFTFTTASGSASITGLPFAHSGTRATFALSKSTGMTSLAGFTQLSMIVQASSTLTFLVINVPTGASGTPSTASFTSGTNLDISIGGGYRAS